MPFFREPVQEKAKREQAALEDLKARREAAQTRAAEVSAAPAPTPTDDADFADESFPTYTVWRRSQLPETAYASVGVPFAEGVASVFIGAIAFIPVALYSHVANWNFPVAAVLTVALSYAIISRRVVVGRGFVAVRKFGPYRLALNASLGPAQLRPSAHGGVLVLRTQDGHTMRLRRVEFSNPAVNEALRGIVLGSGKTYDEITAELLSLPPRKEFLRQRYLTDAFD